MYFIPSFLPISPSISSLSPNLGMIRKAMEDFDINIENSVIVGDRDDMEGEMGRKLGIEYIILKR